MASIANPYSFNGGIPLNMGGIPLNMVAGTVGILQQQAYQQAYAYQPRSYQQAFRVETPDPTPIWRSEKKQSFRDELRAEINSWLN